VKIAAAAADVHEDDANQLGPHPEHLLLINMGTFSTTK